MPLTCSASSLQGACCDDFHHPIRIEFNHCDPAGIVFYPRYFEMTNSTVETFFREVAGHSYAAMMESGEGVPTARLEVNFHAPRGWERCWIGS